jgi:hypothetical protein
MESSGDQLQKSLEAPDFCQQPIVRETPKRTGEELVSLGVAQEKKYRLFTEG